MPTPLKITDVVLRDAHQSLLATRMRLDDLLPILDKLDAVGLWSVESWGGATFDSCIRFLGEDPWDRLRQIKAAMPHTPQQMLLRGQNILGYRHYADDVVRTFVERAATNGIDVFRVFDAMNDPRNLSTAIKAVIEVGKHAQGALSYTISPVHTTQMWVELASQIRDMGAHSICIKDMAGLLKPYVAYELVSKIKDATGLPVHLHAHATTGMSVATLLKATEAGVDMVDTAISSMSMTYGHSPTESMVAILEGTERDTGLDLELLEEISAYFREVRKKYHAFEGALKGADSRILVAQVPGGMLTNLESQLKKQNASDRMDEVLEEIPKVRKDLGYIPLVTPTSQIVGTQAVMNVLAGERYQSISKETQGILRGEYGASPAPVDKALQNRVLGGDTAVTCRPADLLEPEMDLLFKEVEGLAQSEGFSLAAEEIDDVLIYALFAKVGLKFLKNRGNPEAFEPVPNLEDLATLPTTSTALKSAPADGPARYRVHVSGKSYLVEVEPEGAISRIEETRAERSSAASPAEAIPAPLAGDISRILVHKGQHIGKGDLLLLLEAMKMETEVRSPRAGLVEEIMVLEGDSVAVGDVLLSIG